MGDTTVQNAGDIFVSCRSHVMGISEKKNKYLPADLGIDFCQMCLRAGNRLGNRDVLESHHIIEISTGGEDKPENILVLCTSCHRLTHHQRTYLNIHLSGKYSYEDLKQDLERDGVPLETRETLKRIFLKQEAANARLRN